MERENEEGELKKEGMIKKGKREGRWDGWNGMAYGKQEKKIRVERRVGLLNRTKISIEGGRR